MNVSLNPGRTSAGVMADAIRHFDWSATSIGPMPDWPPALSTLAGVMLAADRPMWIGWGDNLTILYNDAYAAILGAKHPAALGRPVADVWPEARAQVAPLFARVLAGEAIKRDDLTFTTERHGWPEEAHFAVSYTPVRDPSGRVAGIFGTNNETTDAVLTARRSERERWRLARMFEQAPSFMMLLEGPEHRLTLANAAARNFAGGRVLVGRTLAEALPEAAAQGYVALLDEVFASGQPYRSTGARLLLDPPSGGPPDERFMEFIYQPLFDGPGQVTGIFVEGTDITRHVRAVERHRESEEHLRLALDFGDLGSWHYDAACGKLLRSARHDEIYGYDSSLPAAGYDKFLDHITPQDRAAVDAALASAAAGGGPWRFECRITRLDSEERWIGVRGRPVLDDQGRISRVFGTIADITERKQDELRLRDLNARLEAEIAQGRTDRDRLELALNAAGVIGVWDGDLVAKIVYGDANFARIYGVDPAAAIAGQPLGHYYAFIHPDDRAAAHDIHQSVLAEGQIYAHDHRIIRPNGEVRYIQARGYMQRDAAGTPVRFAGVSLDQTERRVAERRQMLMLDLADRMRQADDPETLLLAASVALGRHLRVSRVGYAQALPDGQMVKITCGYVDGVPDISGVIPMNRFGEDLLAPVRRGETIAIEDVTVGAAPEHIARWQEISTRAHAAVPLVREGVYRGSLYVSHHQPRSWTKEDIGILEEVAARIWDALERVRAEAQLREANARLEERVAAALAERAKVEEALRQSQKMEAVGQLTGGLAHDFNNLLTGISGSLELLKSRIGQGRLVDAERYIAAAEGAASRAAALTHRLLAFSRRQTLDPKPTAANRLILDMVELIQRTAGPAVRIETRLADGLWTIACDPHQLENAILNLSINARDAMPGGGDLRIETRNATLDAAEAATHDMRPGDYVRISVTDTGVGMKPEVKARAFDPFFTTKPIGQGTGLGLSMIYGFARQSDGHVSIASVIDQGTTVAILLPRGAMEGAAGQPAATAEEVLRAGSGEMVLVVDDEPTVRMLVTEVLQDLGYTPFEAEDGKTGLAVLQSAPRIDLLITDVGLPGGMNGRQMADAARLARPGLKILFITGYAEQAVLRQGALEPGMHVLSKPFALDGLARRIKQIIDED